MNNYVYRLYEEPRLVPYSIDILGHRQYLSSIAKNQEIVELGVRCGFSSVCFLTTCSKLTSYDIILTDEAKKLQQETPEWTLIEGNSLTVEIPECDILFIDTLHSYEQLFAELNQHHAKARKLIIMHDTNMPSLKTAVADFLAAHSKWSVARESTESNGLTTLSCT